MVPGASPGAPRGLPEASLGPPGAIFEDMQRNAKKQEKLKGSPDPIFQKKRDIYRPRLHPEIVPEWPWERKNMKNDVLFYATVGVTVLVGFSIDFPSIFRVFFSMCFFSRIFQQFWKNKNIKVLKTL